MTTGIPADILSAKGASELFNSDQDEIPAGQPLGSGTNTSGAAVDVGNIVEGTVVKLAEYGAIVRLHGGRTGLIHISEIADTFVRDVKDYFKEQDRVRVKILSINNRGRYELSTKKIEQPTQEPQPLRERKKPVERPPEIIDLGPDRFEADGGHGIRLNFEDRLSRFLKDSQERQTDIKRNIESKRGTARKR